MPRRVHHIDLPVRSATHTEEFYREVFGWLLRARLYKTSLGWTDSRTGAFYGELLEYVLEDGSYITFITTKTPDYSEDEPHLALLLTVKELDMVRTNLKRLGIEYEENSENISFYDPSLLRVELYTDAP